VVETGGLENMPEEIGLSVFSRLRRYSLGQFGMIRAGSAQNWATIWATDSCNPLWTYFLIVDSKQ